MRLRLDLHCGKIESRYIRSMSARFFTALWLGLAVVGSTALAAEGSAAKTYPATEAKNHVGEEAFVTGKVDAVRAFDSGMVLVNLDGRYPDNAFTILVQPANAPAVGDLAALQGKRVAVWGKIILFHDKPEIEITARSAIKETEPQPSPTPGPTPEPKGPDKPKDGSPEPHPSPHGT